MNYFIMPRVFFYINSVPVSCPFVMHLITLSQTGSTLARINLSPFVRCTLGLDHHSPRHLYSNILCDHCFHDLGLYIQKLLTNKEMVNFQKLDFLRFLTANAVTTGARELNWTSVISLATHNSKREMREI